MLNSATHCHLTVCDISSFESARAHRYAHEPEPEVQPESTPSVRRRRAMAPTRADTQKLERVPHGGGEGDSARARPGEPQTSAEQACSLEDELDLQVRTLLWMGWIPDKMQL